MGLESVAKKKPKGFSLGMGQRLGLATAILAEPEVLLLDEPANGLDPQSIHWLRDYLKYYASQGRTVLVSSHLLSEMEVMADHVVVIARGRLLADESVEDLVNRSTTNDVLIRSPRVDELAAALTENSAPTQCDWNRPTPLPSVTRVPTGWATSPSGTACRSLNSPSARPVLSRRSWNSPSPVRTSGSAEVWPDGDPRVRVPPRQEHPHHLDHVLFVILAAAAFAYLGTFADDFDEGLDRIPTTDLVAGALLGNPIVIVLIASLGAMAFGHEYRYGTIRLTLTAFPGGGRFLRQALHDRRPHAVCGGAGCRRGIRLAGPARRDRFRWSELGNGRLAGGGVHVDVRALLAFSLTLITRNHPLGIIGPLILFLLEQAVIGLLGPGSSGCRRCCRWPRCSPGSPAWMSLCRLEFGLPGWWVCCWSGWFCCGAATPDATATTWSHYARRMSSNRVTKAVIPAAGLGTRFLPATKATPKEMLPVVDRPAIQYVVEEAVDAGLDDVLIITGRNKSSLEDHFDRNPMLERTLFTKNDHDRLASVMAAAELAKVHYVRQRGTTRPGPCGSVRRHACGRRALRGPARRRPDRHRQLRT